MELDVRLSHAHTYRRTLTTIRHMNSVDKNDDGDYMISARYTNAIYKISEKDGSLLWTLGGLNSDFELEKGFNFSRQHDVSW